MKGNGEARVRVVRRGRRGRGEMERRSRKWAARSSVRENVEDNVIVKMNGVYRGRYE